MRVETPLISTTSLSFASTLSELVHRSVLFTISSSYSLSISFLERGLVAIHTHTHSEYVLSWTGLAVNRKLQCSGRLARLCSALLPLHYVSYHLFIPPYFIDIHTSACRCMLWEVMCVCMHMRGRQRGWALAECLCTYVCFTVCSCEKHSLYGIWWVDPYGYRCVNTGTSARVYMLPKGSLDKYISLLILVPHPK